MPKLNRNKRKKLIRGWHRDNKNAMSSAQIEFDTWFRSLSRNGALSEHIHKQDHKSAIPGKPKAFIKSGAIRINGELTTVSIDGQDKKFLSESDGWDYFHKMREIGYNPTMPKTETITKVFRVGKFTDRQKNIGSYPIRTAKRNNKVFLWLPTFCLDSNGELVPKHLADTITTIGEVSARELLTQLGIIKAFVFFQHNEKDKNLPNNCWATTDKLWHDICTQYPVFDNL